MSTVFSFGFRVLCVKSTSVQCVRASDQSKVFVCNVYIFVQILEDLQSVGNDTDLTCMVKQLSKSSNGRLFVYRRGFKQHFILNFLSLQ